MVYFAMTNGMQILLFVMRKAIFFSLQDQQEISIPYVTKKHFVWKRHISAGERIG